MSSLSISFKNPHPFNFSDDEKVKVKGKTFFGKRIQPVGEGLKDLCKAVGFIFRAIFVGSYKIIRGQGTNELKKNTFSALRSIEKAFGGIVSIITPVWGAKVRRGAEHHRAYYHNPATPSDSSEDVKKTSKTEKSESNKREKEENNRAESSKKTPKDSSVKPTEKPQPKEEKQSSKKTGGGSKKLSKSKKSDFSQKKPKTLDTLIKEWKEKVKSKKTSSSPSPEKYIFKGEKEDGIAWCKTLCDEIKKDKYRSPEGVPLAPNGKVRVYLPTGSPYVIKQFLRGFQERFSGNEKIRQVLKDINASSIRIPQSELYDHFLIEEKVPVSNDYDCMQMYVSNPKSFDQMVQEFVALFEHVYFDDLVAAGQAHPIAHVVEGVQGLRKLVRYDNVPFYLEGDKPKVSLIDTEDLKLLNGLTDDEKTKYHQKALTDLARIFPHHEAIIREAATDRGMTIDEEGFKKSIDAGRKVLKKAFTDYKAFLEKNRRAEMPFGLNFSDAMLGRMKRSFLEEVKRLNTEGTIPKYSINFKNFLGENTPESLFDPLIEKIKNGIQKQQLDRLSKISDKDDLNLADHMQVRSGTFKRDEINKEVLDFFKRLNLKYSNEKGQKTMDAFYQKLLADHLLGFVMKQLVDEGEVFYFDLGTDKTGFHRECLMMY